MAKFHPGFLVGNGWHWQLSLFISSPCPINIILSLALISRMANIEDSLCLILVELIGKSTLALLHISDSACRSEQLDCVEFYVAKRKMFFSFLPIFFMSLFKKFNGLIQKKMFFSFIPNSFLSLFEIFNGIIKSNGTRTGTYFFPLPLRQAHFY